MHMSWNFSQITFIFTLSIASCTHQSKKSTPENNPPEPTLEEREAVKACFETICADAKEDNWRKLIFESTGDDIPEERLHALRTLFSDLHQLEVDLLSEKIQIAKQADLSLLSGLSSEDQTAAFIVLIYIVYFQSIENMHTETHNQIGYQYFTLNSTLWESSTYPSAAKAVALLSQDKEISNHFADSILYLWNTRQDNAWNFSIFKYGSLERTMEIERKLNADIPSILSSFPPRVRNYLETQSYEKGLAKIRMGKHYNLDDLKNHYTGTRVIRIYSKLLPLIKNSNIDYSEDLKNLIANLDHGWMSEKLEVLRKSLADERYLFSDIMRTYYKAYPTTEQNAKFHSMMSKVKSSTAKKIVELIPKNLIPKILKKFDAIEIEAPDTRDEFLSIMEKRLKDEIGFIRKESSSLTSSPLFQIAALIELGLKEEKPKDLLEDSATHKMNIKLKDAFSDSDYSLSGTNSIKASWMSVRSHGGISVMRHELGHQVLRTIMDEGFEFSSDHANVSRIVTCLNEMHPEKPETRLYLHSSLRMGFYLEEDFADLVASFTGKKDPLNLACFAGYGGDYSFFNPDKEDKHPSYTFRILHHNTIQGTKLPKQCSDYLAKFQPSFKFKNCAKP